MNPFTSLWRLWQIAYYRAALRALQSQGRHTDPGVLECANKLAELKA